MSNLKIAIGEDSFETIRGANSLYVDKSPYLKSILETGSIGLSFTCPMGFGKTTFQTMLSSFLDIRKDSKKYFEDLEIYKNVEFAMNWMNQYPIIYISLKEVEALTFERALGELRGKIAELFRSFSYIVENQALPSWDKNTFLKICNKEEDPSDFSSSLLFLSRLLFTHYKKKVFILI